ncbi:MAG: glycoside hydrolase/phage tail family protein [Rhizobiaceae bacterium]
MATMILQTAGAALGSALGPFGTMVGRAAGALAGNLIDRKLFSRDRIVEGPRLAEAQILSSSDGAPMPKVYGRSRIGGQLVWATRFEERRSTMTAGGKGGGPQVSTSEYSYYANFAVALCEGPVSCIRRIWADGAEIDQTRHEIRFYAGTDDQPPDPLILARQGEGNAPAFRGTAYLVFEDFPLSDYGNRIPQLSFEVVRSISDVDQRMKAVCLIPGATEFGYDPTPVSHLPGTGKTGYVNRNNFIAPTDWQASLDELQAICPHLEQVALVVPWFGTDLRASHCQIRPGVEHLDAGGEGWSVSGLARSQAHLVSRVDGAPAYGGTPSDNSVITAIADLRSRGLRIVLYPFLMMDIGEGNMLPDPHGAGEQPAYPWRGLISCSAAPGMPGTPDRTLQARAEINAFCGNAASADFTAGSAAVVAVAGTDFGYRRMILHYAHLAQLAGGVDGFLIGSEFRGLTTLRDEADSFPFVEKLVELVGEVRQVLGQGATLTYAADWTEYFGYHPANEANAVYFHLDPLWAHPEVGAVGIDNYMPLTDWRMDGDPAEGAFATQFDPYYARSGVGSGEGFDWYYASDPDRRSGNRTAITDGEGEAWAWRYKDIASWWSNEHHERKDGLRNPVPTAWVPASKPVWFTEFGCPAVSMGANQPNVFGDPKSSQSALPHFSTGSRCDLAQHTYLRAHLDWWGNEAGDVPTAANPVSPIYGGPMVDTTNLFAWAWDARPFPAFPLNTDYWSDGANWNTGHWLNGRLGGCPLPDLLSAMAEDFGLEPMTVNAPGHVDGYVVPGPMPARAAMEPLVQLFGAAFSDTQGSVNVTSRTMAPVGMIDPAHLVDQEGEALQTRNRQQIGELPRQLEMVFADLFTGYEQTIASSLRLEIGEGRTSSIELPVIMPASMATGLLDARLNDLWTGRDHLEIAVPWKYAHLGAGDLIRFEGNTIPGLWQIETIEDGEFRSLGLKSVVRTEELAGRADAVSIRGNQPDPFARPDLLLLDLPLDPNDSSPKVYAALSASPFAPGYALHSSPLETGYTQRAILERRASIGHLVETPGSGRSGRWDYGSRLLVRMLRGDPSSLPDILVLNGQNAAAILCANGEWEILQFASAELMEDGTWSLRQLLRGQMGTQAAMESGCLAGCPFVLLDRAVLKVPIDPIEAGLALNWRASPVGEPLTPQTSTLVAHTHQPVDLRPLSPVHLSANRNPDGSVHLTWIRRSRIDADNWEVPEIPLGETVESYRVEVLHPGGTILRTSDVVATQYDYGADEQVADFGLLPAQLRFSVCQLTGQGVRGSPRIADFSLQN